MKRTEKITIYKGIDRCDVWNLTHVAKGLDALYLALVAIDSELAEDLRACAIQAWSRIERLKNESLQNP